MAQGSAAIIRLHSQTNTAGMYTGCTRGKDVKSGSHPLRSVPVLRSCVKVEVDVLGSPSLTHKPTVSVDIK